MTHLSREELLQRWRLENSLDALGELLKTQRDRAYSIAARLTASGADAEDAVQEAFIKLFSRRKGFDDLEQFDLSVYRAVVQCSLDARRSARRRAAREERAGRMAAETHPGSDATENDMSESEMQELRTRLRTAVADLPEEQRAPAVLCYYHGMSEVQAAEVLAVPRTTLRRRLSEALVDLRKRVGQGGVLSAALLMSLLGGEETLAAPASLCSALDATLPGRPCAEIPALSPKGSTTVAAGSLKPALGIAAALVAAAALLLATSLAFRGDPDAPEPKQTATPTSTVEAGETEKTKEEPVMKKKIAGLGMLAGGLLFSGAAAATEPSPEVAGVIAKIKARQIAKTEAAEKDAADRAKAYAKHKRDGYGRQ